MDAGPDASTDSEQAPSTRADETTDEGGSDSVPADALDEGTLQSAVRQRDTDEGTIAGEFTPSQPVEPQPIDAENAAFVLLGIVLVVGLLFLAIAGI